MPNHSGAKWRAEGRDPLEGDLLSRAIGLGGDLLLDIIGEERPELPGHVGPGKPACHLTDIPFDPLLPVHHLESPSMTWFMSRHSEASRVRTRFPSSVIR